MKITVHKLINKNLRTILIVAAVTAIALGILLALISGNTERNQIPTDPTAVSETDPAAATEEKKETPDAAQIGPTERNSVLKEAKDLYAARVESMEDSPAVAQLLETLDLRNKVAEYRVELDMKKDAHKVVITFDKTIAENEKMDFDKNAQKYAERILALIGDAEEVQWTYNVKPANGQAKAVTEAISVEQATEHLQGDIKKFGSSAQEVQKLMDRQNGLV